MQVLDNCDIEQISGGATPPITQFPIGPTRPTLPLPWQPVLPGPIYPLPY
jgi:hypothetical protein